MKRSLRFIVLLTVALALVSFLPLYVERTMVRLGGPGYKGDAVEWGWRICTLNEYWSNYDYLTPEQSPAFWLGLNVALALIYASMLALVVEQILSRRKRRAGGVG